MNVYDIAVEIRPLVTKYKHGYIKLRLSHAALMRDEGTLQELANSMAKQYDAQMALNLLKEQLPSSVVAGIEAGVDKAFGFTVDKD